MLKLSIPTPAADENRWGSFSTQFAPVIPNLDPSLAAEVIQADAVVPQYRKHGYAEKNSTAQRPRFGMSLKKLNLVATLQHRQRCRDPAGPSANNRDTPTSFRTHIDGCPAFDFQR